MKKLVIVILLLATTIATEAKQTLVPRYSSFIRIDEQGDTIDARSSRTTLYKDEE